MIKSVNAPALSEKGIDRLLSATAPTRLNRTCTLFDAGYEAAKADIRERLVAEIGRPADDIQSAEMAVKVSPAEERARRHAVAERPSIMRWLK